MKQENRVAFLTWDQVAERLKSGAAAILPIGAAAKEHGFHMPMNTDEIQAEYYSSRVADEIDALIWPTVVYGFYPAFIDYSGSASLTNKTFETMISELVHGILRYEPANIFILNTGISTIAPIDDALESDTFGDRVHHIAVYSGQQYTRAASKIREHGGATHADEIETSLMLAIAPNRVNMPKAKAAPAASLMTKGPLTPLDPASPNFSPSGSCGDPTRATQENGQILLDSLVSDVIEEVRNITAKGSESRSQSPMSRA